MNVEKHIYLLCLLPAFSRWQSQSESYELAMSWIIQERLLSSLFVGGETARPARRRLLYKCYSWRTGFTHCWPFLLPVAPPKSLKCLLRCPTFDLKCIASQNVPINALQTALLFLVMKQVQKDYESLFKCLLIHLKQPSRWTAARKLFSVISATSKAWGDNPFPDWPVLRMWKIYRMPLIGQIKF